MNIRKLLLATSTLAATFAMGVGGALAASEVTWWAPNWEQPRINDIIKQFEKENPDIHVNLEATVSQGLQNRILVALQSGSPPDLIDAQNGWNIPFANRGLLTPIGDILSKDQLDMSDFLDSGLATTRLDGKLYGVPYRVESHAIIYNKGMFRDAGLDPDNPPQTWSAFVDAAKKLTRKDKNGKQLYGFAITGGGEFGNTVYRSLPFLRMNGGGILGDGGKKVIVNTPESVAGVEYYTDMYTKYHVSPPSTLGNDGIANRQLFTAGVVAMYQSGQYDLPTIHKDNPKIDVGSAIIPHPKGKETTALLGGWNWIVPKDAKHKEAVAKLLAFLAQPEIMAKYTDTFPARKSAMKLPRFQDPELKAFKEMLPHAKAPWAVPNWIQITQTYFNYVQSIMAGQMQPQDAMNAAADEIKPMVQQ